MARGWTSVALTVAWLGLVGSALAQPLPGPGSNPAPPPAPPAGQAPPGGYAPMPGGAYMGLPCPPPGPPCPPEAPPCEGPTDNTQFDVPMFHFGFDYLYWFVRRSTVPPLATSGSFLDPIPGALGQQNTQPLPGSTDPDKNRQSGGRFTLGIGVDTSEEWSLMASAFLLGQTNSSHVFSSTGAVGTPVLARPFYDVVNRLENADPVAIPGVAAGILRIELQRRLYGGDLDLRYELWATGNQRMHLLGGVKLLWLEETLGISEVSQDLPGVGVPGNTYSLSENMSLVNRFYGGQFGALYEFRLGPVFLQAGGKVALGINNSTMRLNAYSRINEPNGIVTTANDRALYVSPNNAGSFNYPSRFAVAPEGTFKFGFDFNDNLRVAVGYTFLYWSDVARPGESVQRNVNIQPIGTPLTFTPTTPPNLRTTNFWAQGLDVSLRLSF